MSSTLAQHALRPRAPQRCRRHACQGIPAQRSRQRAPAAASAAAPDGAQPAAPPYTALSVPVLSLATAAVRSVCCCARRVRCVLTCGLAGLCFRSRLAQHRYLCSAGHHRTQGALRAAARVRERCMRLAVEALRRLACCTPEALHGGAVSRHADAAQRAGDRPRRDADPGRAARAPGAAARQNARPRRRQGALLPLREAACDEFGSLLPSLAFADASAPWCSSTSFRLCTACSCRSASAV